MKPNPDTRNPTPDPPPPGRRIAVVGVSGSGKTTTATRLAEILSIPYVCNDALIFGPNWTPTPTAERPGRFTEALAGDAWTFDGNFGSLSAPEDHHVLARIDTLVWLDLPRRQAFPQLLRRTVRRAWTREELWHGNRESWRMSFASRDSILWWAIKMHHRTRRRYAAMFADPSLARLTRIRLRSRREVDRWLGAIGSRC